MNAIDIVLGGGIIFGAVRGFSRGLLSEIASLLALVLGVYGAFFFSDIAYRFLEEKTTWSSSIISTISYIITFVLIILTVTVISNVLTKIIKFANLGLVNKVLGGLFGGIKIGFLLGILLMFFSKLNHTFPLIKQNHFQNSVLFYPIVNASSFVYEQTLQHKKSMDMDEK